MLRLRYAARLVFEFGSYARVNRAWWILAVIPIVVVAWLLVGSAHVVVPYTVYTFF